MRKEKKEKRLWKGIFKFNHEIYEQYVRAFSADQAKVLMLRNIAKRQGVTPAMAIIFFKDHDTFSIVEEE